MAPTLLPRPLALWRNVADLVRQFLFDGRFQPGEELSDTVLAAEFGVSRGPVREALLILAEDGLVEHNHNHGFVVPRLATTDLEQIAEARHPLEVKALELARPRITSKEIRLLQERKDDLVTAFQRGGMHVCATPDFAFHSVIWHSWPNADEEVPGPKEGGRASLVRHPAAGREFTADRSRTREIGIP